MLDGVNRRDTAAPAAQTEGRRITMRNIIENVTDGLHWFFNTGWEIWSSLFAPLPYGDPYIATAAALLACVMVYKNLVPTHRVY